MTSSGVGEGRDAPLDTELTEWLTGGGDWADYAVPLGGTI